MTTQSNEKATQGNEKATQGNEKATQGNEKATEKPSSGRYCAYDLTLLRFVGDVLTDKAKVGQQDQVKAAKKAGHDVEVREV